ncbi:hypothetical protein [Sporichthya brevicatena]|uniref:hypothetical protein n=1 Tax=Sporichthya brevicatena TaxID=171442 RepID=UPI0031E33F25
MGARDGGARLGRGSDSVGAHVSRFARCPVVVVPPDAPVGSGTAEEDLLVVPAPDPGADLSSAELVELTTLRHAHCPVVFVRAQ